jgi:hypothetical protein
MKLHTFALLAAAGLSLTACGGHKDEEAAPDANMTNITLPAETAVNLSTETPVPPPVTNTVEAPTATPVTLAPDEQTEDDAAAAGMTARVSRDEEANTAQPVR